MSDETGDENDRTVYQPKSDKKSKKGAPAQGAKGAKGAPEEEQPQPDGAASEATRFEKPSSPPESTPSDADHEATRFEKPATASTPSSADQEATRFEKPSPTQSPKPSSASEPVASPPPPPASGGGRKRQFADGEVLNGIYKIKRFIARGGMGEVYEASNIHQQQERVAIKVMLPHLAQDELVAAMFGKEAEMLTRLHHEAIVPYRMAARDANGLPYIVTEFIDGASLEERLGKLKLSDEQFATLAQKLAAGLGTAHNLGAIHRDIAPDNVLLSEGDPDRPKIIDFGIAKDARENSGTIVGDGFAGKLKYVAPEQLGEFDRNIGPWTDLYSLALTLRTIAAGAHSDMGGSLSDAVRKRQSVPDLSMLSERFRPAFNMALQPDPKDRPQSMAEFILRLSEPFSESTGSRVGGTAATEPPTSTDDDLDTAPAENPIGDASDVSDEDAAPRSLASNKMVLIGGVAAAFLLIVVVSVVIFSSGGSNGDANTPAGNQASASGSETGGQSGMAPDSPEFAALAAKAIGDLECAWLTYAGGSNGTARFIGGAANPAAAQSSLVSALEKGGAGAFSIDLSEVARFEQRDCAAVDAMRTVRSEASLITTPRQYYEAEDQELTTSDGVLFAQGALAKIPVRLTNIPPNQQLSLLQLEIPEGLSVVSKNREDVEYLVQSMKGDITNTGMAMVLAYQFEAEKRESSGIFLLSSPNPIPSNISGDSAGFDDAWVERFTTGAKANGWQVDAVWVTVEDKVRDN